MPRRMIPPHRLIHLFTLLSLANLAIENASAEITSIQPRTVKPSTTTVLTLTGTDLDKSLRVTTRTPTVELKVLDAQATQARVEVSVGDDHPLGPIGLWFANSTGPIKPQVLIVDDLTPVTDNGKNHSLETAQPIEPMCVIEGASDVANSDFYRLDVSADQRVAFEMQTQPLGSAMDPVLRILDADGRQLHLIDDDTTGPDFRFSYQFAKAGDYYLQIHDNRFSAGGSYRLRVGDFPILRHAFPLAVRRGHPTKIAFSADQSESIGTTDVNVPTSFAADTVNVAARVDDGVSSAWTKVIVSDLPQETDSAPETNEPISFPVGISGRLSTDGEHDSFSLQGTKGKTVRIASRTRRIDCPTLLQMRLFDAAGVKVAETAVSDSDEWSFNYTFPEDAIYRLEATDLLGRGGAEFGYWIEIKESGSFSIALKPDKATVDQFAIEPNHGACSIDVVIDRFGYEGAINLDLVGLADGVRIVNPRIPAKAKAARIYLAADQGWKAESFAVFGLRAIATEQPERTSLLSSTAFRRQQEPHVLVPPEWRNGSIVFGGVAATESPFALEVTSPLQFARTTSAHTGSFKLKRINEAFKAGVTILPDRVPVAWRVIGKNDKDSVTVTLNRTPKLAGEPDQIALRVFGQFQGRSRIETVSVPIQWIDPLKVTLDQTATFVPARPSTVHATILRQGNDDQSVLLKLIDLPPGITGPESIEAKPDQSEVEIQLNVSADAKPTDASLRVIASSKYQGADVEVSSDVLPVNVMELPSRLSVYPSEVLLVGPDAQQQLVVTGFSGDDSLRDWTRDLQITCADAAIAKIENGVVYPLADGETEITVHFGDNQQTIPLRVSGSSSQIPTAFESDVLVALSKQGCNSGACHGSPSGKGGFRLSLRAFDKQLDELTLIREDFGRRVNTLEPERSLLLAKPTMAVEHGGGKKLRKQDDAYKILHRWISEGAKTDPIDTARCDRLEVFPSQKRVLSVSGGKQQLAITAKFSDDSARDVTRAVAYSSSNTGVATVDEQGLVTPHSQGETVILVRFLEHIESIPLMFVDNDENFQWQSPPTYNYVDELIDRKLELFQYQPSETCTDSEFLRRVYLDVIGTLPTVGETEAFLADSADDKRAALINQLLQRDEHAKFWAIKWGDLLKMTGAMVGDHGVHKYHRWVEESIRNNTPYDEFARQLVTATGSTLANPPANFYRTSTNMNECVETISQVFLGLRLQCAKCHNHPFERWTQDNYYGLGAFFHRVGRRNTPRPGETFVYSTALGEVTQPRTGQTMQPWLPKVGLIGTEADQDRRLKFAEWLVDAENPYFARIEANRIWSQFFSRGIVDPIDDFRESNPPANEPLLDALAKDFVESGFDRKHLIRVILNSRTYQSSYQANESNQVDHTYFSHQEPRLLGAEQLLDAINQSLGLTQTFGNLPPGTKATQLPAPDIAKVNFLKIFGQPERMTVCACERSGESNLGMAIELFNGAELHNKLRDSNNRFRAVLARGSSVEETIREIYAAALCRQPSDIELKAALTHCAKREDPAAGVEDVCWALFNTDEFVFQH